MTSSVTLGSPLLSDTGTRSREGSLDGRSVELQGASPISETASGAISNANEASQNEGRLKKVGKVLFLAIPMVVVVTIAIVGVILSGGELLEEAIRVVELIFKALVLCFEWVAGFFSSSNLGNVLTAAAIGTLPGDILPSSHQPQERAS